MYVLHGSNYKGELKPEISLLHMKILTLIKAKSNFFHWYVQCCSCTRKSKTKILTTRAPPSWIEFDVVTSNSKCFRLCNATWINYLRLSNDFSGFFKRSINAATWKSTIASHIQDVAFDGVTSQRQTQSKISIFCLVDALVVNILVFDVRVQLQHCTYIKTLLFALIKVSTFICKRGNSGFSSPLKYRSDLFLKLSDVGNWWATEWGYTPLPQYFSRVC